MPLRTALEIVSFHVAALLVAGLGTLLSGFWSGWPPALLLLPLGATGWLSYYTHAYSPARWRTRDTSAKSALIAFAHVVPGGILGLLGYAFLDGSLEDLIPVVAILSGLPILAASLAYCVGLYGLAKILRGEQAESDPRRAV